MRMDFLNDCNKKLIDILHSIFLLDFSALYNKKNLGFV